MNVKTTVVGMAVSALICAGAFLAVPSANATTSQTSSQPGCPAGTTHIMYYTDINYGGAILTGSTCPGGTWGPADLSQSVWLGWNESSRHIKPSLETRSMLLRTRIRMPLAGPTTLSGRCRTWGPTHWGVEHGITRSAASRLGNHDR